MRDRPGVAEDGRSAVVQERVGQLAVLSRAAGAQVDDRPAHAAHVALDEGGRDCKVAVGIPGHVDDRGAVVLDLDELGFVA